MLPRLEFLAAILMIAFATWTTAASAHKEHIIIILRSSYFPTHIVLSLDDTVRFVNASGYEHEVTGEHQNWSTGLLPAGAEVVLEIDPDMLGMFFSDDADTFQGSFSLDAPKHLN